MLIVLAFFNLDMRTDITDFLFAEDSSDSAFLVNQLQADDLQRQIILSLEHKGVATERVLDFVDDLQDRLSEIQGIERVWSNPLDEDAIRQLLAVYSDFQIQLRSINPEHDIADVFGGDALKHKVQQILSMLLGPDPVRVKKILRHDPMLLTLEWLQRIQTRHQPATGLSEFSTLFIKTAISGMDADAQALGKTNSVRASQKREAGG